VGPVPRGGAQQLGAEVSRVCRKGASTLSLALVGDVPTLMTLVSQASPPPPCSTPRQCGVYPGADNYMFTNAGDELHPDDPGSNGVQHAFLRPRRQLAAGEGHESGYQESPWDGLTTFVKPAKPGVVTYYYRKTFNLKDSSCFSGMYLRLLRRPGTPPALPVQ